MKRKYPNHVIFRNSNFDFDVCNAISATDCTGLIPWAPNSEEQLDAYDEIINYSPRKCKYLQLRQIADKHFIIVFSDRILFKAIRFTVISDCIGKHRKAVQRNCKSGTDCLDKAFFLCPHLKKRIVFIG